MTEIKLSPAELYAARKLGSKLTKALSLIEEARVAGAALGQASLAEMGLPHFSPAISDIARKLTELRTIARKSVPAPASVEKWEQSHG